MACLLHVAGRSRLPFPVTATGIVRDLSGFPLHACDSDLRVNMQPDRDLSGREGNQV